MAGQVRFWDRMGHLVPARLGEDSGNWLGMYERDVFVLVDDDPFEQRAVEDAAFSRLALAVEVAEVGEHTDDLIKTLVRVHVGVRETVESAGDRVEAGADAVLFGLEQVEWDGVGVVGLDELEAFGFEVVTLCGQHGAFIVAGGFELVEHLVQDFADALGFLGGEAVGAVVAFDAVLDAFGEDRRAGAAVLLASP
ncbi:hypothetical protein K8W59_02370 [Nocardioides rotundus]|uniref:hypothetical protein n=1 Tax=Nocardioides rotundus TaxID=1774216 RepID=UPI001CBBE76A|nr:hypothetical protein [Nocardioides rotundus]UAL30399.1 hypothetical protein K8W59_02370 [Nocardioides rotundus]